MTPCATLFPANGMCGCRPFDLHEYIRYRVECRRFGLDHRTNKALGWKPPPYVPSPGFAEKGGAGEGAVQADRHPDLQVPSGRA